MRAAIYVRISHDPTGQSLGVTRQEDDCRDLAASRGWEVGEIYVDNDVSATSGKPRPAYTRMLEDMEAGDIGAIVCWHPDRLYRRMVDLTGLLDVVQRNKVQVATVRAGDVDLSTGTGQMIAEILASVAQYEVRQKADRWKRAVQQRRHSGEFAQSGKRLYGYTRTGELIEEEAEHTRWMAKQILDGCSVRGLCLQLTERGVLTSVGNEWRTSNLKGYLTNPRIAGYATIGTEAIGIGEHEPILDPADWEQVRALVTAHKSVGKRPRVALLPGLIYCGLCKEPMVTGQRPPKVRTYRCMKRPGSACCGRVSIDAVPVEEIVEGYVRELLDQPGAWERVAAIRDTAGASEKATEVAALEAHLVELEASLEEAGSSVATVLRVIERTKEKIAQIHGELASLRPIPARPAGGGWPEDLQQRRRLAEVVVAAVHIDPRPTDAKHGVFVPERVRVDGR